ncbi:hypothetical protein ACFWOJ_37650 [Streptomyces sp. NPDC058439]|uniref:hypothetical protein n=1 Tax=Streptomyces sp. NPDC058439 TaxID=3346500 RepID=UPI00365E8E98
MHGQRYRHPHRVALPPADRLRAIERLADRVVGDVDQVLGDQAGYVDHHHRIGGGLLLAVGDVVLVVAVEQLGPGARSATWPSSISDGSRTRSRWRASVTGMRVQPSSCPARTAARRACTWGQR